MYKIILQSILLSLATVLVSCPDLSLLFFRYHWILNLFTACLFHQCLMVVPQLYVYWRLHSLILCMFEPITWLFLIIIFFYKNDATSFPSLYFLIFPYFCKILDGWMYLRGLPEAVYCCWASWELPLQPLLAYCCSQIFIIYGRKWGKSIF